MNQAKEDLLRALKFHKEELCHHQTIAFDSTVKILGRDIHATYFVKLEKEPTESFQISIETFCIGFSCTGESEFLEGCSIRTKDELVDIILNNKLLDQAEENLSQKIQLIIKEFS